MFFDFSIFSGACQRIIYVFLGKKIDRILEIWYNPFIMRKKDDDEQDGIGFFGGAGGQYHIRIQFFIFQGGLRLCAAAGDTGGAI